MAIRASLNIRCLATISLRRRVAKSLCQCGEGKYEEDEESVAHVWIVLLNGIPK